VDAQACADRFPRLPTGRCQSARFAGRSRGLTVVDTPARHRAALTDGVDDVGPGVGVDTAVWPLRASTATIRGSRSGQVVADSRATIRVTGGHHQRAPVVVATPDAAARRAMGRNVLDPVGHAGQHRDDMADDAAAGSRRPTRRCRPRHGGSTRSRCHGASSSRARDTSAGSRSSFCCHLVLVPMTAAGRARPTEEAGTATAAALPAPPAPAPTPPTLFEDCGRMMDWAGRPAVGFARVRVRLMVDSMVRAMTWNIW
jgi:hypothetical protein